MENYQFWTLVGMMAAGFAWTIHLCLETRKNLWEFRIETEARLTKIETWICALDIFKKYGGQ